MGNHYVVLKERQGEARQGGAGRGRGGKVRVSAELMHLNFALTGA